MEKKFVKKKGGCICGAIRFNVTLDELPRVFSCHCVDCRKKIGGMMSIIELRDNACLLYTSPSPRDGLLSRMPSSA